MRAVRSPKAAIVVTQLYTIYYHLKRRGLIALRVSRTMECGRHQGPELRAGLGVIRECPIWPVLTFCHRSDSSTSPHLRLALPVCLVAYPHTI
jgi:hypothetical protein